MTNNETRQISPNCTSSSRIELAMVFQHLILLIKIPYLMMLQRNRQLDAFRGTNASLLFPSAL